MNAIRRNTVAIAIATAAFGGFGGQAFAQEATYELPQPAVSTKTRAEVRAELLQARQEGTVLATEADFQRQPAFVAAKSRAEVAAESRADVVASRALTAEPYGFDAPQVAVLQGSARVVASAAR
ncbi:MAG: DUF4148 domain-containing protein [Burkholderiales bacterium]|nr:DUF4148 domain-containing protein [Burkholderiales bacterium]